MKRQTYDLVEEPTGAAYRKLLGVALAECATFQLVHKRREMTPSVRSVLSQLDPFLIEKLRGNTWPGSEAVGWQAELYRFRLTPDSAAVLERVAHGLYSWTQLDLPEDPSFVRADGSLWLATTTHERDAFFELNSDELNRLVASVPDLRLRRLHLEH